jgi:hypothetical protein
MVMRRMQPFDRMANQARQQQVPQPNRQGSQMGQVRRPIGFAPQGPGQGPGSMFRPPPSQQPVRQHPIQYQPQDPQGQPSPGSMPRGPGSPWMPRVGAPNGFGQFQPQQPQGRDPSMQAPMPGQLSPQQVGFTPPQQQQPYYPQPQMPQAPQQQAPERVMGPQPWQPTVSGVPVHSQVPGWDGQGPLPVGWAEVSPGVYVENWNGLSPEQRSAITAYGSPTMNDTAQQAAGGYIDNGPQQFGPLGGGGSGYAPMQPYPGSQPAPEDQGQRVHPIYRYPEGTPHPYPQAGGQGQYPPQQPQAPNQGLNGLTPEQIQAIRDIVGGGGGPGGGYGQDPTQPPAQAGMASGGRGATTPTWPTGLSSSSSLSSGGAYGAEGSRLWGGSSGGLTAGGQAPGAGPQAGPGGSQPPGGFGAGPANAGTTSPNGGGRSLLAAAGVDPRPGVKSQGPPPEDFMLPTSPQFEAAKRELDQELWSTISQLNIAEAQIPAMVELVKSRMNTDMGYEMQGVDESMIDRGLFDSSIRSDNRTSASLPYQRRWQDFQGEVAGQYGEIANRRSGAQTSYNQAIAELLLGLAGDAAQTPGSGVWEGSAGAGPWEDEAPGGYEPGTGYQDPNMPGPLKPQPKLPKVPKKPSKSSSKNRKQKQPVANRVGRRNPAKPRSRRR